MNALAFPPPTLAGNPRPPPPSWVKLLPLSPAEQGENGAFDNGSPLPQNRGHAVDYVRRLGGLRKIDAGETARDPAGKMRDRSGSISGARRHRDWRSHSAFAPAFRRESRHDVRNSIAPFWSKLQPAGA